ncbi:MAG TPA: ABC transporter substrate-binding protein [Chloroflexia bacterium]|nr:ABC transporter substrate-binding protein [Chloroflexia bacterium]
MKRLINFAIGLSLSALVLSACDSGGAATPTTGASTTPTEATATLPAVQPTMTNASGKPDKVRFSMDWTPNTNHTGIYVAMEKGWYKDANLDVELLPYSDANTPDTLVGTGQADFGISFAESVVTDRVSNLPVKSVAAVLQTNTSALATLKSSGLDTLAKLVGKRYAGFGSPFEVPVITTMLKSDGVTAGDFQNITANLSGYSAIVANQADFVWIYMGWEGIQAQLDGVELNTFLLKEHGVPDYYTPVIIGNETFLKDHGDVAKRFLAATAKGYEYGVTNPDDAADLLIKGAPSGTFSNLDLPRKSQEYLAPFYQADQPQWGLQTLQKWTDFPRYLTTTGRLLGPDGKPIQPDTIKYDELFTNDYLPGQ